MLFTKWHIVKRPPFRAQVHVDPSHCKRRALGAIATVASFKRMREYKDMGLPWVVNSLRASTELEVDEAGVNVRRRTEVREPKGQFERSVYAVSQTRS